jgi:guanylate kinase
MSSSRETNTTGNKNPLSAGGRGMLIVVSSPSGGGKGTLIQRVLKIVPDVGYSVSYTTRAPREGEVDGRHYFFVSVETFHAMVSHGDFLESATVHGNLYGTAHARVEEELSQGHDIILEIDVQGAGKVRKLVSTAVMVFVLPPSFEILKDRLTARGSEDPSELALRLSNARHEVEEYKLFDYVIINDDAVRAANQLAAVLYAERARRTRQEETAHRVLETFARAVTEDTSESES